MRVINHGVRSPACLPKSLTRPYHTQHTHFQQLFIPSENCSVMMALSALRTPNPPRAAAPGEKNARSGDPFGDEAKAFTRQHLLQRTVEVRGVACECDDRPPTWNPHTHTSQQT